MAKELKPLNLLAIPCVFNTLLPPLLTNTYKMYASLTKIQSSLTNYSQHTNFRHEKSTTFQRSWPSKTSHAIFTHTWLKRLFPFCLDTPGRDKYMGTKSTVESKPHLLIQFLCSCTYTWHRATSKIFFPQAKNTCLDKCITPYLKQ